MLLIAVLITYIEGIRPSMSYKGVDKISMKKLILKVVQYNV